jgi:glycerol kinase
MLAGLQIGVWSNQNDIINLQRDRATIEPTMANEKRSDILQLWHDAITQCLHTSEPDG